MMERFSVVLASLALGGGAVNAHAASVTHAAAESTDHSQSLSVQDLVRLERVSEVAVAPDGRRCAVLGRIRVVNGMRDSVN